MVLLVLTTSTYIKVHIRNLSAALLTSITSSRRGTCSVAFPKVSSNRDFQAITLLVKAKIGETQVLFCVRAPPTAASLYSSRCWCWGNYYRLLCFSAQDYYFSFATSKTSSVRRKELVGILLHTRKL